MYYPTNPREHTSFLISLGRLFPMTKAQAVKVIKTGFFDVLNDYDKKFIEEFCKENVPTFKRTKSGAWWRITNFNDSIVPALKAKYKC